MEGLEPEIGHRENLRPGRRPGNITEVYPLPICLLAFGCSSSGGSSGTGGSSGSGGTGSGGASGSPGHLTMEYFRQQTGFDAVHVPYRGNAQVVTDLIGGQVQVAFDVMTTSVPHIRTGALRALGVTNTKRYDGLPDVPSIAEIGRASCRERVYDDV